MAKGNAIIGQSGGPTSVINASLSGVIENALKSENIDNVYGMRYGIEGFMAGDIIDLGAESKSSIKALKNTPSSALGSCRYKLKDEDIPQIIEIFAKYNIRFMFLIGGNDTMDTIHRIEAYAKSSGYEIIAVGIPKTVDNDLFGTDHTPGFPSAARYMALSVMQAGILARDMKNVDQFVVYQCIGREAGWLVGASGAGKRKEFDAPHIMCFPERPFDKAKFLADVKRCYDQYGFVSIVCGEGIAYADGTPVSDSDTKDRFNNVEFGAMGGTSAAMALHQMTANEFGFRGEFQITESLPMCAADRAASLDIEEAYICGRDAVQLAEKGVTGVMVTIERYGDVFNYHSKTSTAPLSEVAVSAKPMPDEFINPEGNFVTDAFFEYLTPLIGEMPKYAALNYKPVPLMA
ncbi:Pyrophosphate--fructose 6-phosphate 1-phosphotransferase [Sedimentisphaera cyanobacteriorum]|uniref:Pyrophosphate--fructose 6-phosphate 1-phosphotransferase n=1 Tax=Sedimentisphaera cyanobacteriorum TaxID=1940790 RepID=A0A1Q2HPG1_9BACT|nr:6-phosphofructokinase [Sedimentisphaera cyanobacteriorum]AQQ09221.1 Pyrophosphate--fructose 6-phosphate 1-phosphotransferase [Sedimentisphaera cyanobacteriorum]